MRILHVVPTYVPAFRHGGPVRSVHGLAKALVARGHEVTVFTTDVDGPGRLDVPLGRPVALDGVEVRYFPVVAPRRLYRSPTLGRALGAEVGRFDAVHLHSVFLLPTAVAARAAARAGAPYVVSPRGMLVPELVRRRGRLRKTLWLRLVERRTLARAAALHVTSDLEAADAARLGLPLPPVAVVPNGVEPEPWDGDVAALAPAVREVLEGGPFVLFLGRLSWKKGLDRLVPAMARVPGARLAVAGHDDERLGPALARLAAEAGVAERVALPGPVDGADRAALLARCAALALPSESENFGNAVLEAMAAGRPVVVSPGVGLAPAVAEAGAGLVVAAEPGVLGEALAGLLGDPATAEAMGRRGAALAAERYSWGAVAAALEGVYARMACSPSPGAGAREPGEGAGG